MIKKEISNFRGSSDYVVSPELMASVNVAIALEKPLLIKGEPGTGKTMLAQAISNELKKKFSNLEYKINYKSTRGALCI
ncbi:ATPase [Clostridioides difficile]|nr:ATPase [Clostridioides difficile]